MKSDLPRVRLSSWIAHTISNTPWKLEFYNFITKPFVLDGAVFTSKSSCVTIPQADHIDGKNIDFFRLSFIQISSRSGTVNTANEFCFPCQIHI